MGRPAATRKRARDSVRVRPIERGGARQPERFDPARAHVLGGTERERWLPYARIRELLDVPAGALVVDYGAGTGTIAIPLALDFPEATILAFDEQPAMLERLRAAAGASPPPNLVATASEAAAASVERVLVLNVLHEAGDASLAQIGRMLAPGGYALVVDWRSNVDRSVGPPAAHSYTEEEARERLEAAGFDVTVKDAPDFPYHFVLEARTGDGAAARRRAELIERLRALAGRRVTIETDFGSFSGFVDTGTLGETTVSILIAEVAGGDPARSLVVDLDAIAEIREA